VVGSRAAGRDDAASPVPVVEPDRDPATSSVRTSTRLPVALVLRHRFYRSALLALLLSGMATSAAVPQLTTFFVTELGATLPQAGLYYLTNVTAPVVGFALGRLSDQRPDRLTLFRLGAVVGAAGWTAMGLVTSLWMPFVISVVALGVAGAAGAQVYAAVRDELSRVRPSSRRGWTSRSSPPCGWASPSAGSSGRSSARSSAASWACVPCSS
jgi:hypothetical protein